jgi:hypothetical protein
LLSRCTNLFNFGKLTASRDFESSFRGAAHTILNIVSMSKKAAEHHSKAAEHHTHAARHHGEASKHHESGQYEKAAHHAHTAAGHSHHARHHAEEAGKSHMEEHGKK